jgi:CheY-like chemotaxis protein
MAIEPFFTTKGPGEGSGLGLSMVYGFVRQSGGDLSIDSEPGGGTTVTLYFPQAEEMQDDAGMEVRDDDQPYAAADETILVVEDEARLRRFTARTLFDAGYRVLEAAGAPAARELLLKHPEIRLLFTDIVMPGGTSGLALAEWVVRNYPDTGILLTTGYSDRAARARSHGFAILSKPYSDDDLLAAVRDALAAGVTRSRAG